MDSRITVGDKIDLEKIETRLSVDPEKRPPVYVSQVLDDSQNGELLVANQPIYEVTMIVKEMQTCLFDTVGFCKALQIDSMEFQKRMISSK